MSENAIQAQGTLLQLGSGSPLSYVTIAEILSFSGPGGSVSVIDVTDLSSTAKEKLAGLNDNGQLSFECNFIPANTQHLALREAKKNGTTISLKIIFTDTGATEWTFNAIVTGFTPSGAVDGVVKASVTLEISGDITES
jgi:predicted secreted protein